MLRTEERAHVDSRVGEHQIDDVAEAVIDRGRIADQTNAFAVEFAGFKKTGGAERDVHGGIMFQAPGSGAWGLLSFAHRLRYRRLESPIGELLLAGDEHGVRHLLFANGRRPVAPDPAWEPDERALAEPARQLTAYFKGELRRFELPVAPNGTPFQRRVWSLLQEIPYGETMSYGEVARRLEHPTAVRAVGMANGSNPISIIIPCHRVIGSNGSLVGYGGGLANKQALLALERGQRVLL